ncbi:PREDICTED: mucin-13 [Elephantulus edwardii]|uniref:mucin-13 n=1 Tax=Elephantulus edwardii TaxID=28737 RepID=UPI0003F07C92|nr:PREDICTED: mucin-13 [Elephantulus edwardii]
MTPTPGPSLQPQTTTGPTNPCENANCKNGSTCVALYSAYFCLCTEGFYYNDSALTCEEGKIFPGSLRMIKSETSDLEDKNSEVYQNLHKSTTEFFKNAFKASNASSDYGQTVINKVRSGMRAGNAIAVGVVNILVKSTSINENSVSTIIDNAIKNNTLGISSYSGQSLCDYYGCQQNEDGCSNGFNCKCRPGLQRPNSQVPFCLVLDVKIYVSSFLDFYDSKYLKLLCSFGYTGVNCEDPFQLILTIVGTIAGFLILSLLIALIVSSRLKNKRKNIEEENLIGNDFQNLRLQQTGFSNPVADSYQSGSIFPKIRTANPGKNQLENPYVSQRPMPRPDY